MPFLYQNEEKDRKHQYDTQLKIRRIYAYLFGNADLLYLDAWHWNAGMEYPVWVCLRQPKKSLC